MEVIVICVTLQTASSAAMTAFAPPAQPPSTPIQLVRPASPAQCHLALTALLPTSATPALAVSRSAATAVLV